MAREKDRIFEIAQKISHKRGLKKTVKEYEKSLERDPTDFKTRIKLGDIYMRRGEVAKAIEEYVQVGERYIEEELDLKAIAMFKKILVLNPRMIDAYYKLADLYDKRGLLGEAKTQYQKILKIDRKQKKAQEGLKKLESKVSQATVQSEKTVEDRIKERDPVWNAILEELKRQLSAQVSDEDYQTRYYFGVALKEMGILDKAIEEFSIALMDPNLEFDGYLMSGICHREMGNYDDAIGCFRKGLAVKGLTNKQFEHIYYELGQTFEENGEVENALEAFNRVKELRGGDASTEFQSKVQKLKEQMRGS